MFTERKNSFLFSMFTLFLCLNCFFLSNATAQDAAEPVDAPTNYTFETIEVPGVDFLAITASSDFQDYAGYTKSADGEKEIAFTLIDGVFTTYDFPGSEKTHFYALGNDGTAAGHYQDSEGLLHGVVLENGELQQYDFPDSIQTEIYGISDTTGALTGNWIDDSGVRRGFSGNRVIEFPGASTTYADFVSGSGTLVGSYIDAGGTYHAYVITRERGFTSLGVPNAAALEYFFLHGINDAGTYVARSKAIDDVPRTYIGTFTGREELQFPGSVSTEGWNINQDGSIVGYYDTAEGRRHGFVARPAAQVDDELAVIAALNYTYESIDVPSVDFLAVTASSDFEDYAGYTLNADGKIVGFTLIAGVFTTYNFPGSQSTYFYALGNNGQAAGHYQDSEGLYHGVILENGELRQYDFPGAVQTEIHGISDATGALTGNYIDAEGIRRGFTGETIVAFPGASVTYADFVSAGGIIGSYVDTDGIFHPYVRTLDGRIVSLDLPDAARLEYYFVPGINDAGVFVDRSKLADDIPRTHVGRFLWRQNVASPLALGAQCHLVRSLGALCGRDELRFPGSVSTEGWNVNQDGSIVGHYDSPDGRRHGFIARPTNKAESTHFGNIYNVALLKGLNMLSVPLAPPKPMTAKSLLAMTGATTVITLDTATQGFVAWTPGAPDDGFPIEGDKGYIVNVPEPRNFAFVGAPWTDQTAAPAAPDITPMIRGDKGVAQEAWAFVVSGRVGKPNPYEGKHAFDGYRVIVRNLRTNSTVTASVRGDYFAAATADLERRSVIRVGDVVEVRVIGPDENFESQTRTFKVTPEHLSNAVLSVSLDSIGQPTEHLLLQNYPNPFNPETWIPYQLSEDSEVSISIYGTTGALVRTLSLGYQSAGFYNSQGRAAYWDGRNALGEPVASGVYFYKLSAGEFAATRRMLILK